MFKDNPRRRRRSFFARFVVGMAIAGVTGLVVFETVYETPIPLDQGTYLHHAGVVITGLLIGSGANPTHEAIRLLQEAKMLPSTQNI